MEISSSVLVLLGLFLLVSGGSQHWRRPLGYGPLLGLFAIAAISVFYNQLPEKNLVHGLGKLRWIFIYYFMSNLMRDTNFFEKYKKLLSYLTPMVGIIAAYGISQFWTGLDFIRGDDFVFPKAIAQLHPQDWEN